MRIFGRTLGRKEARPAGETESSEPACRHVVLGARWDSTDDMGKLEEVSSYLCEGCSANFSREEGERLKAEEAERVRQAYG